MWRSDKILSTYRLPLSLAVPWELFRHSTPKRNIRSARLLAASTPCSIRNTQSDIISHCKRLANRRLIGACVVAIDQALNQQTNEVEVSINE